MGTGKYYQNNQARVAQLTDKDWKIALAKCKEHIKWRIKQKDLSGAHCASNLGADPVDHYLGIAYEKILSGEWEWKEEHDLTKQMLNIISSYLSKEVEKAESTKGRESRVFYMDVEETFYDLPDPPADDRENILHEANLQAIEAAAAGDINLELMVEALKEGRKRSEIAELLDIGVRQFDKLKEKLIRRMNSKSSS